LFAGEKIQSGVALRLPPRAKVPFALRGLLRSRMKDTEHSLASLGVILVALHFIISAVHGAAHSNLHIDLNTWQKVYVLVVITALPLVSAFALWRHTRGGFALLLLSMLGSLIFGGYFHFIASGADNVASLGSHTWSVPFQFTAVLLALTEGGGVLTAILGLWRKQ
jgi:hypothetical protein